MIQWDQSKYDARRIYGPQTQRSFNNFKIGDHRIPIEQIKALALVKKACALTNAKCGAVTEEKSETHRASK